MNLPTGIVTFLFTDIEGSTKLWDCCPDAMRMALNRHDELMGQVIESHGGFVFKTVGDAFYAAFPKALDAINAALAIQLAISKEIWSDDAPIKVRVALHSGEAEQRNGDYFGPTLNRVARILAAGNGGQVLLSQTTFHLTRDLLAANTSFTDLGEHRLKDLHRSEQVYQLMHPSLTANFPPLRSLNNPALPNNLPLQVTSFVGRDDEIEVIKGLLARTRLLTLSGSGGCGKTRLSLQVAADALEKYADGVWFVELAPISDPSLVAQTVAQTVGVPEMKGEQITKTLISALRNSEMLLVLDNCEHVLESAARLVDAIVRSCPKVKVLSSSREALSITGESVHRVPSLSAPQPAQSYTPEGLLQFEAVRLFVERAHTANPAFAVTGNNARALAFVCHGLDGIPLAIELAAARVRSLTVEQIATHLDNRFRLLKGGSRTAQPRQKTLRAMIDWSYDLLEPNQKALFCRLSVFMGGWRLEACEKVCCGGEVDALDVLELLTALADKSLVQAEDLGEAVRYRLLETVRQYARERLDECEESAAVRERHMDYYLSLAEKAEPQLKGAEQAEWFRCLDVEYENLRTAVTWSLKSREEGRGNWKEGEAQQSMPNTEHATPNTQRSTLNTQRSASIALRFCSALQRFWLKREHLSEGRWWCEAALEDEDAQDRTVLRAKALTGAGLLAWMQGDYAFARSYHEQSLTIYRKFDDQVGIALSLNNLGLVAKDQDYYASARACHEQSLKIRREIDDRRGIASSLGNLGVVAEIQGSYAAARAYFQESQAILREIGDRNGVAISHFNLGMVAIEQGDYISARAYFEESLAIFREFEDRVGATDPLNGLGLLARLQGDCVSARASHEQSLAILREVGDRVGIADTLTYLGKAVTEQGEIAFARACYEESLAILRDIGDRRGMAYSLEQFASLAIREYQLDQAPLLLGAAEALREEIGSPRRPSEQIQYARDLSEARNDLGEADFTLSWQEGRELTIEQAIDAALTRKTY